ncbi:MAG: hypothetical protein U0359_11985 [Byssovorax sp.]
MKTRARSLLLATTLLGIACGPAAPPPAAPESPHAAEKGVPAASPSAQPAAPAPLAAVEVSAGGMPADVQLYAEIGGLAGAFDPQHGVMAVPAVAELRGKIGEDLGLDPAAAERLLGAVASLHAGGRRIDGGVKVAVGIVFTNARPMHDLIAAGTLREGDAVGARGRRLLPGKGDPGDKRGDALVWFETARLLVSGDEPMVQAVAAVVEGRAPALSDERRKKSLGAPSEPNALQAFVAPELLNDLAEGQIAFASPLTLDYGFGGGDLRGRIRAALDVRDVKKNLPLPPARPLTLARRLPAETAGYLALSAGLPGGQKGAGQLLAQIAALGGRKAAESIRQADAVLDRAKINLADLLGSLGGEAVIGAVVRPGIKTEAEFDKAFAVVALVELADDRPAESLLKVARDAMSRDKKIKLHPEGKGFTADLTGAPVPFARATISNHLLLIGAGQRDLVERAAASANKGQRTLGDDPAHAHALAGLPALAGLRLWADTGRLAELAMGAMSAQDRGAFSSLQITPTGASRTTSGLSLNVVPEDDRVFVGLDDQNSIGIFSAVGIYGVRRYLASAKTAEARNTIGAIARSAVMAYEREQLGASGALSHALCKSAIQVPQAVPHGRKYQSSDAQGADYNTGDAATGWRCLKFMISTPQYYQYSYSVGGPYKGPARGGPDPGPNGFEVAAEGDLDGDGKTSLFTRTGVIDRSTSSVRISTELFVSDEME